MKLENRPAVSYNFVGPRAETQNLGASCAFASSHIESMLVALESTLPFLFHPPSQLHRTHLSRLLGPILIYRSQQAHRHRSHLPRLSPLVRTFCTDLCDTIFPFRQFYLNVYSSFECHDVGTFELD